MFKTLKLIKKYEKTGNTCYLDNLDIDIVYYDQELNHPKITLFYETKTKPVHLLLKMLGIKIYRVTHIYDEVYYCHDLELFVAFIQPVTYFDDLDDFTHDEEWKLIVKERIQKLL